jgi:hypothetical protein
MILRQMRTLLCDVDMKSTAMKQKSKETRSQFLLGKNQPHARQLNKHETAITTWRTIAFLKSSSRGSTLMTLEILSSWPPPFTEVSHTVTLEHPRLIKEWTKISDPAHIEYYLLLRNRLHFGQAHGTPFMTQPLSDNIPWGACSSAATGILSGQYIPQSTMPELCKSVLEHCKEEVTTQALKRSSRLNRFPVRYKSGGKRQQHHRLVVIWEGIRRYFLKECIHRRTKTLLICLLQRN